MKQFAFILCLIYCFVFKSNSQNLVSNGSFENISSCGTQATLAINWQNPTQYGSPDLYNTCAPNWVPAHSGGLFYQWPRTGNSYVGIWCYDRSVADVREYLHTQLTNTLIANNYYFVKFYTNLCNFSKYATNNLGLYFSSNTIYQSGASNYLLNYTSQIKKFNNPIIADTLNWIEISSIYQANGNENYITIGNFNNDATTDTSAFNPNNIYGAYYLLDDISVENITTPQWQYRDTTVYLGDSVLIGPAISGLNVDWFDISNNFIKNAPGIYVKPTVNTSYQATETFNSAVYNHTVNVTVLSPVKVDEYDKLQNSVKAYPNPSTGTINLKWNNIKNGEADISVTDISGKLVYQNTHQIVNTFTQFNIDATNGVYFVKISLANGMSVTKKVIKQN